MSETMRLSVGLRIDDGRCCRFSVLVFRLEAEAPVVIVRQESESECETARILGRVVHEVWKKLGRPQDIFWIEHTPLRLNENETLNVFEHVSFKLSAAGCVESVAWFPLDQRDLDDLIGERFEP